MEKVSNQVQQWWAKLFTSQQDIWHASTEHDQMSDYTSTISQNDAEVTSEFSANSNLNLTIYVHIYIYLL